MTDSQEPQIKTGEGAHDAVTLPYTSPEELEAELNQGFGGRALNNFMHHREGRNHFIVFEPREYRAGARYEVSDVLLESANFDQEFQRSGTLVGLVPYREPSAEGMQIHVIGIFDSSTKSGKVYSHTTNVVNDEEFEAFADFSQVIDANQSHPLYRPFKLKGSKYVLEVQVNG